MNTLGDAAERAAPAAPERTGPPQRLGHDIHIWSARIDAPGLQDGWLDAPEQARVLRYRQPGDQRRFIAGRALLRRALAHYCGLEPPAFRFDAGPYGKPCLKHGSGPEFNLSHAGQLVVCAVSWAPCGIDVEPIRHLPDSNALAKRIHGADDYAHWCTRDRDVRDALLFRRWVILEAWCKASGRGLAGALEQRGPYGEPHGSHTPPRTACWQPEPGYWLAVAADRPAQGTARVRWWPDPITGIVQTKQ